MELIEEQTNEQHIGFWSLHYMHSSAGLEHISRTVREKKCMYVISKQTIGQFFSIIRLVSRIEWEQVEKTGKIPFLCHT